MDKQRKAQVVFHLTGRQPSGAEPDATLAGLRPALFAGYRRLADLRYDFPLVLVRDGGESVLSLTAVVDFALRTAAPPGQSGEALRKRALMIERDVRRRVAAGEQGTLLELWERAAGSIAPTGDAGFRVDADKARDALPVDGEVVDCNAALPARFLRHAWSAVQQQKARTAQERIGGLVIRLGNILRADYARSEAALAQPALQASFGSAHRGMFDFEAMSRLLSHGGPRGGLSERRRQRVEDALAVLRTQRFFPPARGAGDGDVHGFEFATTEAALAAFRERLPELARLLKALQVATLEAEGGYVEDIHDALFGAYDARSVTPQDLEFFPDYLVCLEAGNAGSHAHLTEALSCGVPLKVLVHADDLLEESVLGQGRLTFGLRSAQLASAAMSLDDVFVLQSAASNLLQLRARVQRGLLHAGPALFSIYAAPDGGALPGYLQAAAAMQSRAFPAFSYDPGAGADLASRFSLENNPQPGQDWPVERLAYADPDLQAVSEEVAFTFADFTLSDARYAGHFEVAPRAAWGEGMRPVQDWLAQPLRDSAARRAVRARSGRGRPALPAGRRRAADACHRALSRGVAPAAGTGRHPGLACREAAGARTRGVGGGAPARSCHRSAGGCTGSGGCRGAPGCSCGARAGGGGRGGAGAQSRRALHRDDPLLDLQRVHADQPADVCLQRQQAGLHRGPEGRHVQAAGRGRGELPGLDHPPGQAVGSGRARHGGAAGARQAVPVTRPLLPPALRGTSQVARALSARRSSSPRTPAAP